MAQRPFIAGQFPDIFFISFTNIFVYTCVLAGHAGYAGAYPVAPRTSCTLVSVFDRVQLMKQQNEVNTLTTYYTTGMPPFADYQKQSAKALK
jgi:hypothetical protein